MLNGSVYVSDKVSANILQSMAGKRAAQMAVMTFDVGAGPAAGTVVTCRFPHTPVQQPAQ